MKVLVRNLHNQTFTIDYNEDDTVKQLKEKIAANNGIGLVYDPELIKLLCTGKVMDDEDPVSNYIIKPDGFLVLVKQTPGKPKPPPKKKPNQGFNNHMGAFGSGGFGAGGFGSGGFGSGGFGSGGFGSGGLMQSPFQQNPLGPNAFQPSSFPQTQFEDKSHFPATGTSSGLEDTPPESFSTPEDRAESLQMLVTMGFDKTEAEKALRASFYNVETAIEYITSGNIPNVADRPAVPQTAGTTNPSSGLTGQGQQPNPAAVRREGSGGGGMGANLQQMRQMLQENPEQLQVLKQTIQAEHPEIAQLIEDNPQDFLDMLNQAGGDEPTLPTVNPGPAHGSGAITVNFSANEQEMIERLQSMGFERNRVIEAFLACDRNENVAVNYLLNAFD